MCDRTASVCVEEPAHAFTNAPSHQHPDRHATDDRDGRPTSRTNSRETSHCETVVASAATTLDTRDAVSALSSSVGSAP